MYIYCIDCNYKTESPTPDLYCDNRLLDQMVKRSSLNAPLKRILIYSWGKRNGPPSPANKQ